MQVLLYQGLSVVSKAIKLQTRSKYSHAAVRLMDGSVIEAWQGEGVRQIKTAFEGHKLGTPVDVFHVDGDYDIEVVEKFLLSQLGKKYDYWSIARFLSRRDSPANNAWFCSELTIAAFRVGGLNLLNGPASHLSPRDLGLSPLLTYIMTVGGNP